MTCQKSRAHFPLGLPHEAAFYPSACAPESTWGVWASWLRTWWSSCSSAHRTRREQKTRRTWASSSASIRSSLFTVGSSADSVIHPHTFSTHFPSFFMFVKDECCLSFVKQNFWVIFFFSSSFSSDLAFIIFFLISYSLSFFFFFCFFKLLFRSHLFFFWIYLPNCFCRFVSTYHFPVTENYY